MSTQTRTIGLGTVTYRDDGILHTVFDFDGEPTMELAQEYMEARQELVGLEPVPVVVEIVRIPYTSRDVRSFFMGGIAPATCRAVVTADHSYRTMFKTFEQVAPSGVPSEFFTTVAAAVDWINDRRLQES